MGDDSNTVRVPRAWIFMVMGAAIIGAGIAAVVMVSWIVPRLTKNEAARTLPVQNTPANEPTVNREIPQANTPGKPPPVKPPLPPGEGTKPPEEIPPPPPPPPEDLPEFRTDCVWVLPAGSAFKFMSRGEAWAEGTETTKLKPGMRIKVTRGQVEFDVGQCRVLGLAGSDMNVTATGRDPKLVLYTGKLLLEVSHGVLTLTLSEHELALRGAILCATAGPASNGLELTCGEAASAGKTWRADDAPLEITCGAAIEARSLDLARATEIENALRGERDVLLAWDFDAKQLPCTLGKRLSPGFRKSAGALTTSLEFAAIGDEGDARFVATENSRIRLSLKTNARYVRVSLIAGTGRLAETWTCTLLEHERDQWSLYEFSLRDFSKPFKEARPLAGQECHSLQFRMRFDDHDLTLPSERYLLIDDVEIFSPK